MVSMTLVRGSDKEMYDRSRLMAVDTGSARRWQVHRAARS